MKVFYSEDFIERETNVGNRLYLVRNTTPAVLHYHRCLVKHGMYFGFVRTPFGKFRAVWDGRAYYGSIPLRILTERWRQILVDRDEVDVVTLITDEAFRYGDHGYFDTPWFVTEQHKRAPEVERKISKLLNVFRDECGYYKPRGWHTYETLSATANWWKKLKKRMEL